MTLQDPFARPGHDQARRARRRLAALESALTRDTPTLASMFDLFYQLTKDEPVRGAEPMPTPPRRRRLPPAHVAVLVALAAIAALCLVLSTQIRPVTRQCASSAAVTATTSAPRAADTVVRGPDCAAYPTKK